MKRKAEQFDLFVPFTADLPLRDTQETMERPFFSLAKRKRVKPIEYVSPDNTVWVKVYATPEFGMATIWDADILIWAASKLNAMRKTSVNDLPRTLHCQPFDILKTINRNTGGTEYRLLREGLARLQSTTIRTNIRPQGKKRERQFSWIESWSDITDDNTGNSLGMTITVSDWFYEGVLLDKNLLSIDPNYFGITGGRERWLYRVARKHAGGAGERGFAISLPTLFEKSGAEGTYRRFKFEMLNIVARNELPDFQLHTEAGRSEPSIRMIRNEALVRAPKPAPTLSLPQLTSKTIELVRKSFPGWDVYALKSEFDMWLTDDPERLPDNYQKAFFGFVKQAHERSRGPNPTNP